MHDVVNCSPKSKLSQTIIFFSYRHEENGAGTTHRSRNSWVGNHCKWRTLHQTWNESTQAVQRGNRPSWKELQTHNGAAWHLAVKLLPNDERVNEQGNQIPIRKKEKVEGKRSRNWSLKSWFELNAKKLWAIQPWSQLQFRLWKETKINN